MSKSYRDATIKYQRENNLLRGDRTSQAEKNDGYVAETK